MAPRKLVLNATEMHTAGHIAWGLWRLPDADSVRYTQLSYWTELATLLEDGGFDALFIADALGQLDSYTKSADPALATAAQTPLDDPLLVISGMAAVTSTLGFGVTVSTTYEQPYLLARKFTTLDHLTGGRIGWNIVTSQLDSAARNLGYDRQIPHDERYERAQEFVDVTYKLWEGSWEDGAVVADRERGIYADPRKVHAIGHHGRYYSVPSAALSEPSVQRTPVIYQAGTSPRGREFAARNAEVVFVAGHSPEVLRKNIGAIKSLAVKYGRSPDAIKFVASTLVITDSTDAAAAAKLRDYQRYYSVEGALTHFSAVTGIDWSEFDLDAPLEYIETESNRSFLAAITKDAPPEAKWTLRKFLAPENGVSYGDSIVGGGKSVADQLASFAEAADLDGFNLNGANPHQSYRDLADHVIPELRSRGLVREAVPGQTLRQRLFDTPDPRLPADHPGSAYRGAFDDQPSSAPTLL
ncbi:FMN-dependent oxidoreductase (nitrilotriacetate monooxygenase family) [Nocardia transvalensis]|uniref:FMN-dependent oxidoreductase (Nitrilotriacetate monooxygenase family) n=1 Tax=Nocardia transvalensis TaxID=37333 RepID=A0A7W9PAA6_9NOCA|nr:LLM class flavin-dependent oxidoreductase [Nocardia transvalensis]MBB5912083.1 FMN-dependent oxidoreductase (nitrilotriacetate monooxygenase family) [Nocardia transvalensis]